MVPFRLRLEAERFKRENYVLVPRLLRVLLLLGDARTVVFHCYNVGRRVPFLFVIRR